MLSNSSIKKYASVLTRIHKAGYSQSEILSMTDLEVKQALGMKSIKAVKPLKRNIKSLSIDDGRKPVIINEATNTLKKEGWKGKGLEKQKNELIKTLDVQKIPKQMEKQFKELASQIKKVETTEKNSYGIIEVQTDGDSFWIKFDSIKSFNEQFDFLKEKYNFYPKESNIIFHGYHGYKPFVHKDIAKYISA